jgi:ribosomal protein S18 acetylase RimI-like enzyme
MTITLRPMLDADLAAVLAVQAACYLPAMQESADIVLARLRTAPETCLVACEGAGEGAGEDDPVCAYVFAYASRLGAVTPLGAGFSPAPEADTLYIHDLAVAPHALGRGLARRLAVELAALGRARGLPHAALVAVQDSRRFWQGLGFAAHPPGPTGAAALATYPGGALYMARRSGVPACCQSGK